MLFQSSGAPCEGCSVALYGCEGPKALYLREAMLQGGYPQVGRRPILKAGGSRALPADSKLCLGTSSNHFECVPWQIIQEKQG